MSVTDELRDFEKMLETAIKSAFEEELHKDDELEISADNDTHSKLNAVVKKLDLEVYGMSITPSEFTVTFKFCGEFRKIDTEPIPNYCRIRFENNGNYYLTLTTEDLKRNWYLGITDINFNFKNVQEGVMLDCLKQFSHVLLIKIISN